VDGDGDLDVIINGRHNFVNESILYLNDGSGNFTQSAGPTFLGGTSSDVQFGDIDGDNDLDFVVMGWGNSNITFLETYLNDGNGNFTLHAPSEFIPSGARSGEISIADANGNGKNDVFLTGLREIGIYVTHYYMNYTPPCTSSSSITLTECDSYEVPSGDETYTTNGIYKDTIPNFNGCDSVITIDLTIVNSSTSNQSVTTCGSYDWNGTIYNSTGTYNQTIPNHLGCDSVMTLNLVVNQEATGLDVQSACDDFTWIDGNTYTSSNNTATYTTSNTVGCDSIITLDLTIYTVDVTVTNNQNSLTANATNATYQWIDCSDSSLISDATNADFFPPTNGDYAVIITQNNCTDTSDCYAVSTVGLTFNEQKSDQLSLFPNPSMDGMFTVNCNNGERQSFYITDVLGKVILRGYFSKGKNMINLRNASAGSYILYTGSDQLKLIKK